MDISTIKSDNLDKINKMLEDENELNVKFSTKWAEHEAVIYLQQELEKYRGIFDTTGIQIDDKGISYDGRIQVINNANRNKNEWIGYIDIQVKGTCVDEIKRGNSKFTVDVSDLENYAKHPLGVLFFVVQIKKDTLEKKIFYRFLLPVDLQKIFRTITNQKTKTIDIYPIASNQKNMLKRICFAFLKARDMQVGKRIIILDKDKQPIEFLVQDFREDKNDYLKDKVYMYVKLNEDEGLLPAIMPEGGKIGAVEIINKPIIIRGIKYYDSFKKIIEEDTMLIQCGNNITFDINTKVMNCNFQGTIDEIINDMKFALMFTEITENDSKDMVPILRKRIDIIKQFKENLKNINITLKQKNLSFKDTDYINMENFNNLINKDKDTMKKVKTPRLYTVRICKKNIVLFLTREGKEVKIYNFFDNISKKIVITVKDDNEYIRICPYTILLEKVKFYDILNYDKDSVIESLEDSENNNYNKDCMNILALELINSYDKTKDEDFYQAAEKIIDKLLEWEENNSVEIINRLQLIKRKRNLTNEEINILYDIKNRENQREEIQYGISILLENKADIEYYYKQLSKEKKEQFSKLPIENLKNNIK